MSKKYMIILILFQLLVEINCQMTMQRQHHTATLIDNKLYILGGLYLTDNVRSNDFFYLDFSSSFNTQKLLWQHLSNTDAVPPHDNAASVKGGADNSTLFLYGGITNDNAKAELVYTFNPQSNVWSTPIIAGTNTIRKRNFRGIISYNGKMYLWGGMDVTSGKMLNDML